MKQTVTLVLPPLCPEKISADFLMVILFPKSTSKSFPVVMRIAEQASLLKEGTLTGKPFFVVGIKNTPEDVSRAVNILDAVTGWKGTRVFISGRQHESPYKVRCVLDCLLNALQCTDPRAHCQTIGDHPVMGAMRSMMAMSAATSLSKQSDNRMKLPPKILFPCRYIQPYFDTIQHGHPSSIPDQIQAAAVRHGCHWCPMFDAKKVEILENH